MIRQNQELDRPPAWRASVRLPLRRVSGCRAIITLYEVVAGSWTCVVDTGGPGIGSVSRFVGIERYPNRHNALQAGMIFVRDFWTKQEIPTIAADVDELLEAWWEDPTA